MLLGMPDIELLNILNINCNTIGTEKEEKGANCNVSKYSILSAGSEQCCANKDSIFGAGSEQCCLNTGLERSCAKTNSNTNCYTNRKSNSNNRPYNAFYQQSINSEIECSLPGPSRETDTNNNGNSNLNIIL